MAFNNLAELMEGRVFTPERMERLARATFTGSMRLRIYDQVAVQLENGRTLAQALEDAGRRASKRYGKTTPTAVAVNAINRRLRGGESFARALEGWAPRDEILLIDAGERGGELPRVMRLAVKTVQQNGAMRSAVLTSMIEPSVLAVSLYAMLLLIGIWVVPPLAKAVPPERWQGTAHGLYVASEFTQSIWVVIAPASLVAAIALCMWSMPRWRGRLRVMADGWPPYSLYRMFKGLAWLSSFVALTGSGVTHTEALGYMLRFASPWLAERLRNVLQLMRGGANLGVALEKSGYGFPDAEVIDDVLAYVDFPDFDDKIAKVADQWAERGVARIQSMAKLMNFVVNLGVYALMIYLILGVNSLQTQLSSNLGPGMH